MLFNKLLHPDYIRDKLTVKQLREIAWIWSDAPFGHDIDHSMMAKVAASLGGGSPADLMPRVTEPLDLSDPEQAVGMFPDLPKELIDDGAS